MAYGWLYGYYMGAHRAAASASASARSADRAISEAERMRDAIERQTLVIQTLLTFCERKGLFNEQEFRELMNEIDLSDGFLDGKFKPQHGPQTCAACGKISGRHAVNCMYCGVPFEARPIM
jgi:hypothetical protein